MMTAASEALVVSPRSSKRSVSRRKAAYAARAPGGVVIDGVDNDEPGRRVLAGSDPNGNRVECEFIDIFRIKDGPLVEHWTSCQGLGRAPQSRCSSAGGRSWLQ
jgi:hypothetical protein